MSISSVAEDTAVAAAEQAHDAAILERAGQLGRALGLEFAGAVPPRDAWALSQAGAAKLVDVRTVEERSYVGFVPGSLHVVWATGISQNRNPRFLRELEAKVRKDDVVLLLCRSGKRSAEAAAAAARAGFGHVYNVLEGFEGDQDERRQRGRLGGWRRHDLPWEQD